MTDLDLMQITLLVGACSLILGAVIGYLVFRVGGAARIMAGSRKLSPREAELVDEAERRRLREIYNLISKVTSTLKYQRVLDTALDLSASVLPSPKISSDRLVSAVMLFSKADTGKPNLTVGSARRFTPADMRIILLGNTGLIGSVLESGEGMLSTDVASDPELSRFVAVRACGSAYCTPLRAGLDTYGVMLYAHPDRDYFTPPSREVLDILAHQAVIAIQNARLTGSMPSTRAQRRCLGRQLTPT